MTEIETFASNRFKSFAYLLIIINNCGMKKSNFDNLIK